MIVLCALYGALRLPLLLWVVATIFVVHSAVGHKEYRYFSPALPLMMTLAGIGSTMAANWLADRLGQPQLRRALMVAVPLVWTIASLALAASPNRIWFWVRSRGSILAMRAVNADEPGLRRRHLSRQALVAVGKLRESPSRDSALRRWRRRDNDRSQRL